MKKYERKIVRHNFDDFVSDLNLWNIITGGSGQSLNYLRNIVDATYHSKPPFMPRILLVGGENCGVDFHAKATIYSFCPSEIREICCPYIDNDSSKEFFQSDVNVAHLIYSVNEIRYNMESILWRYLKLGWCGYANIFRDNSSVEIINCNGLVVLTANNLGKVSKKIAEAVDHVILLEEYTIPQFEEIILQRLKYYGITYENNNVINEIVHYGNNNFTYVMQFLKKCLIVIHADMRDKLTTKDVESAAKLK